MAADVAVLVGDQNQLPPLVVSDEARALGMNTSLFEVLSTAHPAGVVSLSTQFRMNRDINNLVSGLFSSATQLADNSSNAGQ